LKCTVIVLIKLLLLFVVVLFFVISPNSEGESDGGCRWREGYPYPLASSSSPTDCTWTYSPKACTYSRMTSELELSHMRTVPENGNTDSPGKNERIYRWNTHMLWYYFDTGRRKEERKCIRHTTIKKIIRS
jgi:hypothetical protein